MNNPEVFVIAEAGVNHNGDMEIAHRLIDLAADAGADAVKFQTFRADRVAGPDAPKAAYQLQTTDTAESQFEMLRKLELARDAHHPLKQHCKKRGVEFMSTPFDPDSADFLAGLGIRRFKIGSGELTNLPFLAHVARHGLPMILSTGMACLDEVRAAAEIAHDSGAESVAVLHCVSNYPADPADTNLLAMKTMEDALDLPVGLSDHTLGVAVATGAVALGATIIEKHFTLDRDMPGPDHRASIDPDGLKAMVAAIRTVTAALGDGIKKPTASEKENRALVRRSLVSACDIAPGTIIEEHMIDIKRPGTGMPPATLERVIGRCAKQPIPMGILLAEEMLR